MYDTPYTVVCVRFLGISIALLIDFILITNKGLRFEVVQTLSSSSYHDVHAHSFASLSFAHRVCPLFFRRKSIL